MMLVMENRNPNVDVDRLAAYIRNADVIGAELRASSENIREVRRHLGHVNARVARLQDFYGRRSLAEIKPRDLVAAEAAVERVAGELAAAQAEHESISARRTLASRLSASVRAHAATAGISVPYDRADNARVVS